MASVRICMWAPREGCVYLSSNTISSGEEGDSMTHSAQKGAWSTVGAQYTKICKMNQWTHFSIRTELLPASIQALSQLQLSWESGRRQRALNKTHILILPLTRVPMLTTRSISPSLQIMYKVWFSSLHAPKLTSWSPSSPKIRSSMKSEDARDRHPGGYNPVHTHAVYTRLRNAQLWDILWKGLRSCSPHSLMHAKSLQSCPNLCNPMDCSPPGSSVRGILQARILEWVAIFYSKTHHVTATQKE